jgi:hypothetical protein
MYQPSDLSISIYYTKRFLSFRGPACSTYESLVPDFTATFVPAAKKGSKALAPILSNNLYVSSSFTLNYFDRLGVVPLIFSQKELSSFLKFYHLLPKPHVSVFVPLSAVNYAVPVFFYSADRQVFYRNFFWLSFFRVFFVNDRASRFAPLLRAIYKLWIVLQFF